MSVAFLSPEQNLNTYNLKERGLFWLTVWVDSVGVWLSLGQKQQSRMACWGEAVCHVEARKSRKEEAEDKDSPFYM